ncbi:MAG: hypothetical protein KOO66_05965 [Bacteroidales bacterium]|nr:hypothetical protein [Bacteroidales bacterium]
MKNSILLILIVFIIISCKTQEKIKTSIVNQNDESPFILDYSKEIISGKIFYFIVKNNSDDTLTILSPSVARIEKRENDNWRRVKIIYCPCGANCIAPPKKLNLIKDQSHKYSWNLLESWCGDIQENGMPETIKHSSESGLYRIKIEYNFKNKSDIIIKEFEIK